MADRNMTNDDVISVLNNLIETCKDGQEGFKTAGEGTQDSALKTLFFNYSQQRAQFAGELQGEVRRLGGDPEKTGSTAAALHRGWIDIKSAITGKNDTAIINECERGEDSAVSNYRDALGSDLPADVRSVVEQQFTDVKAAHDRIRDMKHARSANA
ncbi:MAG: PA2169 family four-helix-bundle protein [Pyrinomonadaceae bacterium]